MKMICLYFAITFCLQINRVDISNFYYISNSTIIYWPLLFQKQKMLELQLINCGKRTKKVMKLSSHSAIRLLIWFWLFFFSFSIFDYVNSVRMFVIWLRWSEEEETFYAHQNNQWNSNIQIAREWPSFCFIFHCCWPLFLKVISIPAFAIKNTNQFFLQHSVCI